MVWHDAKEIKSFLNQNWDGMDGFCTKLLSLLLVTVKLGMHVRGFWAFEIPY